MSVIDFPGPPAPTLDDGTAVVRLVYHDGWKTKLCCPRCGSERLNQGEVKGRPGFVAIAFTCEDCCVATGNELELVIWTSDLYWRFRPAPGGAA